MKSLKLTLLAFVALAFLIATLILVDAAAVNYDEGFETDDDGDVIMTDAYDNTAGNGPASKNDDSDSDNDEDDRKREYQLIMKSSTGGSEATKVVDNQKIGGGDGAKVTKEPKEAGETEKKDKKDDGDDEDDEEEDKDDEAGAGGKD